MHDKLVIVVDGNSLLNRAHHAMRGTMTSKNGVCTKGIYGFVNMMSTVISKYTPGYMAVAWDVKSPTFRHEKYTEYKAGRKPADMDLVVQFPYAKKIIEAMGATNIQLAGYEADDILGTISKMAEENAMQCYVLTGDKDALQLVSQSTTVMYTLKGVSALREFDLAEMEKEYGLTPKQFIDLKALMGDKSDNLPGVDGIGKVIGERLLKDYHDLDGIYANLDKISSKNTRTKLEASKENAYLTKELAEICKTVPLSLELEDIKLKPTDVTALMEIYNELDLASALKKLMKTSKDESSNFKKEMEKISHLQISSMLDLDEIDKIPEGTDVGFALNSDFSRKTKTFVESVAVAYDDKVLSIEGSLGAAAMERLVNKNVRLCGHSLIDDIYALKVNQWQVPQVCFDAEVAEYVISSRKSDNLSALVFHQLGFTYDEEDDWDKTAKAIAVLRLKDAMMAQLEASHGLDVYNKIELPLIPVLADMEKNGMSVDVITLTEIGQRLRGQLEDVKDEIYQLAEEHFNISSPQQVGYILFDKLGLPPSKKNKTGYSTSVEVLQELVNVHPIVGKILEYRSLSKLISTYVDGLSSSIGWDGKIHPKFQQSVASTGRISCTEPNLQNIPVRDEEGRQLRKAFVSSFENGCLMGADYSQIELRVLAHMSGDEGLIESFKNGEDIHTATAAKVLGIEPSQVTAKDRSHAKAINFGIIYGMSPFGLSKEIGTTVNKASKYIEQYFDSHEKVKEFMEEQKNHAKEHGYTETILGRRRYIPEIQSSRVTVRQLGERMAMNSPIQGSAADIIKIAMVKVHRGLADEGLKSQLVLQVHDELIIDVAFGEAKQVEIILEQAMKEAMSLSVNLVTSMSMGDSWYKLK